MVNPKHDFPVRRSSAWSTCRLLKCRHRFNSCSLIGIGVYGLGFRGLGFRVFRVLTNP